MNRLKAGIEEILTNRLDSSLLTPEQNHRVFQEIKKLNKRLSVEELKKIEQQIIEKLLIEFKD